MSLAGRIDPGNVRIELFTPGVAKIIGWYEETAEACGTGHGWHNVPVSDGGRPTSYALCPASCAYLETKDAEFRLSAFGWCGVY